MLLAAAAWHIIPDSPETARYLSRREKKVARLRLRREKPRDGGGGGLSARDVLAVLGDPVAWLTAAMFFLANMAYSSLPVFLPLILTEMGHDALTAQALAAPPYLAAFVLVLASAHASDRMRARAPLLVAYALASAAGYAVLAFSGPLRLAAGSPVRYLAVYPATVGFFNVVVLLIAWNVNNQRGESRQGGAFALFQMVGQCGPLVGTRLYPHADGPFYHRGMSVMTCAMLGVAVLAVLLRWYLVSANRRLDAAAAAAAAVEDPRGKDEYGDDESRGEAEGLVGPAAGGTVETDAFRYML